MRLLRQRLSVQQITVAAIALLILFSSTAVLGLVWSSMLLQQTGVTLVRAAEGLRLASDIEQRLFAHQRSTILGDAQSEEAQSIRRSITETLRAARLQADSGLEAQLLEALSVQVAAYLERHPIGAGRADRTAVDEAVDTLRSLAQIHELNLEGGNLRAQRLGSFFKVTAMVAAALALSLVLLMGFTVRRMILRPILELREALVRFRDGDYYVKANERAPRELSEIAGAFNEMVAELVRRREEQLAFVGGVAHDLRNPLGALKTSVAVLENDRRDFSRSRHTLRILSRQLGHLERMVGDLVEASRLEAGQLDLSRKPFDLRDAALAVAELYAPSAGSREIRVELSDDTVPVSADRVRIEQVIGNLVKNAIKHSPDAGRIALAVSRGPEEAEVAVADDGIGIAEDELDAIFQPFRHGSRTAATGAGLGLSIVHRIVAAHGGSVSVESAVGVGSTFRVRLPLYSGGAAGSEP